MAGTLLRHVQPASGAPRRRRASPIVLTIVRDCDAAERESLIEGLKSLAKEREVWLGIPEGNEFAKAALPV